MKHILFIFLIFLSSQITNCDTVGIHLIYTYKNVPTLYYEDSLWAQSTVTSLSKYLNYIVNQSSTFTLKSIKPSGRIMSYVAYNRYWILCVRFNKEMSECQVELFGKNDDIFDCKRFKAVTDFYFLYN